MPSLRLRHDALFLALVLLPILDHSEPVWEVNLVFKELPSIKTKRHYKPN